ncbi:hypothetical protein CK203_061384 [Vitis vinifera]|uniref:Retrotransposon gag domain-containing protein n=1 Tax=Vitis vinifera TaxID=29760 RepID=A0A438GAK7_VITVI|nr:hypothetical protein CK203_061384 [Vitis vinifera]
MDSQQSRHVVLEDTSSDLVAPPILPVQMPATQTLYDQAAVVPPIVTPVTIVEDPRSCMDKLERRIGQMRDLDEMISWDDPDDVPVATLPVGFRMPDIERYTGVGCPHIHLRLYSTVMRALGLDEAQLLTLFPLSLTSMTQRRYASLETSRRRTWEDLAQEFLRQYSFSGDTSVTRRELEFLRQGSDESVSSFISRWREKAAEMIERLAERDQMSISLVQALFDVDDGISIGLWSDIIPSSDTEGKGVVGSSESYGDVCSADFQHRRPSYHPYARSLQIPRSDFPPLQHRHPHSVQQYPSVHPHTVTVRPSFQFQRPQTSIPRHEQSRPHRRHQRTYSDLGMPLDRAFERLRSTGFFVPLAPRPLPSTLPPRFHAHEFCAFHQMAGHRIDYCASLRHTIQDLIDSGAVSFPVSTTDTDLGPDMTADSLPAYSTHAVPSPSGLYRHCRDWSRAEIDGMMVMIFSEYIEIRLLQLRFTMSDEIAPITLTTLYEMMVDLTRRVERIELILSEHPSSSRGAPGVAMPSLPHLTSPTPVTLGASHPRPRPHLAMGFLAPLAPRALPDPVPPQFRLDLYCVFSLAYCGLEVECEEFEPRVDPAWRGLAYDIWVAYDMRIGRLLDETVTYLADGWPSFRLAHTLLPLLTSRPLLAL